MTIGGGNRLTGMRFGGNIGFFFTMGTEEALKAEGGDRNGVVKADIGDTFLNLRVFGGEFRMPLSESTFPDIVAINGIEEVGTLFCTAEC